MGLVLQLVETRADGGTRSVELMELGRPGNLRDIADLGLTLPEAKQLLACVQQAVVAAQARDHATLRPDCASCGERFRLKDWRSRRVATLFGEVVVRLPRFRCPGCGRGETGTNWPAHCRSTPELDQLQAHLSALMTYRVAVGVLAHLLPVAAGTSHGTLRRHTLELGERLRDVPPRSSRTPRRRPQRPRSPSAWMRRSSGAATRANGTWRCASATPRRPGAAGSCSAPSRTPAPTSWR